MRSSLASIASWSYAGPEETRVGAAAPRSSQTQASCQPAELSVTEAPEDDLACIKRIGRGDQRAYRELVDRYLGRIVSFALRILNDRAEAEEVAQETFLKLWTEAKNFEPRAQPKTWLYRIARNQCIDRLRRKRSRGRSLELDETDSDTNENAGVDRPSLLIVRKQTAERVQRALDELPERQRAAITLVHYEGLSGAEASQVLDISVEALESLLTRGRRSLRDRLRELAGTE